MALIRPLTRALSYEVRRNGVCPTQCGGVQENGFCTMGYILVISPFNPWYIAPYMSSNCLESQ